MAVNQRQLSAALGISRTTIWKWHKEGLPRNPDGSYDPETVRAWITTRQQSQPAEPEDGEKQWNARYRKAKAELAELDLNKRKCQLVEVAEVDAANVRKVLALKQRLLMLPRTLAPRLVGLDAEAIDTMIDAELRAAIRDFAGETDAE